MNKLSLDTPGRTREALLVYSPGSSSARRRRQAAHRLPRATASSTPSASLPWAALPPSLHWFVVVQAVLREPIVVAGVALGNNAVGESIGMHLNDTSKVCGFSFGFIAWRIANLHPIFRKPGIAFFSLFLVQLQGGSFGHFFKYKTSRRCPAQNYVHALLGLLLIALAFWQFWTGYRHECSA